MSRKHGARKKKVAIAYVGAPIFSEGLDMVDSESGNEG